MIAAAAINKAARLRDHHRWAGEPERAAFWQRQLDDLTANGNSLYAALAQQETDR